MHFYLTVWSQGCWFESDLYLYNDNYHYYKLLPLPILAVISRKYTVFSTFIHLLIVNWIIDYTCSSVRRTTITFLLDKCHCLQLWSRVVPSQKVTITGHKLTTYSVLFLWGKMLFKYKGFPHFLNIFQNLSLASRVAQEVSHLAQLIIQLNTVN